MRQRKVRIGTRSGRSNRPTIFWSERCPTTNKLIQRTKSFATVKDAEIAAHVKSLELNSGIPSADRWNRPLPWTTFVSEFIASKRRRNVEASSIRDIENTLAQFVSVVGMPSTHQFSQALIDKFIDFRLKQTKVKTKAPISPATINKDLRNLKSLVIWGKENEYLQARFRIHPLKTDPKPVRRLSDDEVKALITNAQDPELRLGIIIAVYTGLRRGDIWALRREQIDVENNCLRNVVEKKSRKITEIVRMSPVAMQEIKRYLDSVPALPNGNLFSGWFPNKHWEKLKKVVNCKFHDLRRTCGSMLGGVASSGWVATKQLGHTDPKVTNEHYMNVDKELTEAHSKMPTTDWGLTG